MTSSGAKRGGVQQQLANILWHVLLEHHVTVYYIYDVGDNLGLHSSWQNFICNVSIIL